MVCVMQKGAEVPYCREAGRPCSLPSLTVESPTLPWPPCQRPGQTLHHPLGRDGVLGGRPGAPTSRGCKPPSRGQGGSPPRGEQAQHRQPKNPHPLPVPCLHSGKPTQLAKTCCLPQGERIDTLDNDLRG